MDIYRGNRKYSTRVGLEAGGGGRKGKKEREENEAVRVINKRGRERDRGRKEGNVNDINSV